MLALVSTGGGACGGDEERSFVDPNPPLTTVTFDWPAEGAPLPAGALRLQPKMGIAYYDTVAKAGEPLAYEVFDAATGANVTKDARLAVRAPRYGRFGFQTFYPTLSASDGIGVVTVVGARVGDKVGFAHLAILQLERSGSHRDVAALAPPSADPEPTRMLPKTGGGVSKADIAIVMDTTGSMGGSIDDLVTSLQTKIFPDLQRRIPDLAVGLVEHKDYPVGSYGGSTDFPVKIHKEITTDVASVRTALSALKADGGADGPESQVPAMYHALTGAELKWAGGGIVPKREPPAGRMGAIGFRPGALPVVVLVNDIDWHESTHQPYDPDRVFGAPTMEQLATAFNVLNARFVSITQSGQEAQPNWLSDRTGSNVPPSVFSGCPAGQCCTGTSGAPRAAEAPDGRCRLNFLHSGGSGVSGSLINAILGLSLGSIFDVSAKVTAGTSGVDGSALVTSVRPLAAGDAANGCTAHDVKDGDGDGTPETFVALALDKPVCFEVTVAKNTLFPAKAVPQILTATLEVKGDPGQVALDKRTLVFVVPPTP
ncbi:MAG: VWA domain-containing protein [Deltaproteobacteria bacterium]|nr:VWA domain-containing protein [Deltaproteobacteria bacterium]